MKMARENTLDTLPPPTIARLNAKMRAAPFEHGYEVCAERSTGSYAEAV